MISTIDIDQLSESQLVELNRRIVQRVKLLRAARTQQAIRQFRRGDLVSFQPEGLERIYGVVARINTKTVTVDTADGGGWRVAPGLLRSEEQSLDLLLPAADRNGELFED